MNIDTFLIIVGSFTFGCFFKVFIDWAKQQRTPKFSPKIVMARPKRHA